MPVLKVKNLKLSRYSPNLSQPFNFSVAAGQCLGLSGPSGIGKSVLLKALADMLPHDGQVYLDDIESRQLTGPQWRQKVTLLPAESQWWCETVGEHFDHYDEQLFQALGFQEEVMDWQISHLSSGEKQRLACIRVLMKQPQVLLLDEPTANLDKHNRAQLETLIANYRQKHQIPVLWISHDGEQLSRISQEILYLGKDQYDLKTVAGLSITESSVAGAH